jgi:hypothetical protein
MRNIRGKHSMFNLTDTNIKTIIRCIFIYQTCKFKELITELEV